MEGMIPAEIIAGQLIAKRDGQRAAMGKSALAMKTEAEKVLSPFDKGYKPSETPTSSHTSKKVSTGTVYTKNYKAEKDVKEEVEELKELSKKTLGSYIKKSSQNAAGQTFDAAHKLGVRAMNGPAMQDKDNPHGDILAKQVRTHFDKANSRLGGISKATDKLTREEKEGSHEDEKQDKAMFKKMFKKAEDKDDKSEKENSMKEERHLTPGEEETKEHNVKSMKKGMAGFKERYGNRAKSVMYATATKQAKNEEVEELDEVSLGLAAKAYGQRASDSAESSHGGDDEGSEKSASKADKTYDRISKKFGAKGTDAANKSFIKQHFGEEEKQPSFTGSHQGKSTIKHIKNPTVQQRMFAHDIKPGIAGYRDRIAVLKDAERMGNLKKEEAGDDSSLKIHPSHIDDSVKEFGAHKTAKTIQKLHDDGHIETVEANKHLNYINKNHKGSGTSDYKIDDSRLREEAPPFDKPYHNTGEVKKDKYGNVVKNVAKHLAKKGMPPAPKNEEVEELDELNKDTLHSYAKKAEVDQDKQFTKVGKAIRDNDPETGNKAGHKFSKRSVGLTKAYGKLEKESIGGISSMSEAEAKAEGETDMNTKTVDGLRGRVKVPATFHNSVRSYKVGLKSEGKHPEDNSVPFVTDETSHTPMKLAKELAQKSFKKIRTETLGKDGGTSEETKHD